MRNLNVFLILTLFALSWTACEKDDNGDDLSEVQLEINYLVDGQPLVVDQAYDLNGTKVSFNVANFYISGISLVNDANEETAFEDLYLLARPDQRTFDLGQVAEGMYSNLKFSVGVQPEENAMSEEDFTSRPADDPLAMQSPSMHWSWNAGYRFLRVDGLVDTNGNGELEVIAEEAMEYHLGTNNFLTNLDININQEFEDDGTTVISINFDLATLLSGLDLTTEPQTHTGDKPEIAQKVKAQIPAAFTKK